VHEVEAIERELQAAVAGGRGWQLVTRHVSPLAANGS
jgi:hypothetical protein